MTRQDHVLLFCPKYTSSSKKHLVCFHGGDNYKDSFILKKREQKYERKMAQWVHNYFYLFFNTKLYKSQQTKKN